MFDDITGRFSSMMNDASKALGAAQVAQPAKPFSPAQSIASRYSDVAKYAIIPRDPTQQGQSGAAAPSNPFAGANNPAPTAPVSPQQAAASAPQPVAPRQPLGYPTPYQRPMMQTGYNPMQMPRQMVPQQSITQQVGQQAAQRGGAQSVQNYLSALQQAGAGGNNAMMNAPGQMGVASNVGFRGFSQNGIPMQLGGRFVGPQLQNTPIQYQANFANASPNYYAGNMASAPGMRYAGAPTLANTGGVSSVNAPGLLNGAGYGAPQWQTPQPWGNPADPDQNEAVWNSMSSDEKSAYLGAPREGGFLEKDPPQSYNWPTQQGSFYSTSDENAKTHIAPAQDQLTDFMKQLGASYSEAQVEEFMKPLNAHAYDYKDKKHGEGRYVSPMAQEFEKSEIGKSAIVNDPESGYKMVDYSRLMGVTTAAVALLNHKYNELEKQFKKNLKANLKKKRGK